VLANTQAVSPEFKTISSIKFFFQVCADFLRESQLRETSPLRWLKDAQRGLRSLVFQVKTRSQKRPLCYKFVTGKS